MICGVAGESLLVAQRLTGMRGLGSVEAGEAGMPPWAGQGKYGVRFQWGPVVAPAVSEGACVVVDVLRFTTAVEAAVSRGVTVYPYRWRDATAAAFADSVQAVLADGRDPAGPGRRTLVTQPG